MYSAANDPRPQMIPRTEIIPKLDQVILNCNDPRCGPQMIPPEKDKWHGVWFRGSFFLIFLFIYFHQLNDDFIRRT